jgi:hypothetical protein
MTHTINGLEFPFEDYFQKHSGNILLFGQNSRDAALAHVKNWRTVVDIGAHVGISVHCWASRFEQVIAFEPMVDHYGCLVENTKKFSNVTTHNCAMSNQTAMLKGAYRTLKNSGSFQLVDDEFIRTNRKSTTIYDIPSRRLDEYELTDVDLIKVDVEGWEFEVLKGAQETIRRCQPTLMIEFTGGGARKSMTSYSVDLYHKLINDLGYHSVASIDDDTIYVPND